MQEEFRYGQKLEVRGGNYIVEVVGRIPKSTPYVVNMNTTDDRLNVRINGEPFNNLTIKQINVLLHGAQSFLDITEQEQNLEPQLQKRPVGRPPKEINV